jgi:hypothetical protein
VVAVAGHAVGPEGDHRVGADLPPDVDDGLNGGRRVGLTGAVGLVQPVVLVDAQRTEGGGQLVLAQPGCPLDRPALGIGRPLLAPGGGDADDPLAGLTGEGHQGAGQVGLVVGVGPDAEQRAQRPGVLGLADPQHHSPLSTVPVGVARGDAAGR